MIFETVGNKEKPVILMLNGSFSTGAGLLHIAEMISDEFYIIPLLMMDIMRMEAALPPGMIRLEKSSHI